MQSRLKILVIVATVVGVLFSYFWLEKIHPALNPLAKKDASKKAGAEHVDNKEAVTLSAIVAGKGENLTSSDALAGQPASLATSQGSAKTADAEKTAYVNSSDSFRPEFLEVPVFDHQLIDASEEELFSAFEEISTPQKVDWHKSCEGEKNFFQDINTYLESRSVDTSLYPAGGVILDWNRYFSKGTERVQVAANWQGDMKSPTYQVSADISLSGGLAANLQPLNFAGLTKANSVTWTEAKAALASITRVLESQGYMPGQRTAVVALEPTPTDTQALQFQLLGRTVKTLQRGTVFCNKRNLTLCFCKTN